MIKKLMKYYNDNPEDFADDLESLDAYDEYLGCNRRYPMDELDEALADKSPSDILLMESGGHDDCGDTFNPNRNYFCINGIGNLVSTDEKDYSDFLDENFVEDIIENSAHLCLSDGAQEIIDEEDDDEDE